MSNTKDHLSSSSTTVGGGGGTISSAGQVPVGPIPILSPSSSLNPIPSLPAALRYDNQERLLEFLVTHPISSSTTGTNSATGGSNNLNTTKFTPGMMSNTTGSTSTSTMKHIFVFGTSNLRTLILRQVLTNPEMKATTSGVGSNPAAGTSTAQTTKKKNTNTPWDIAYTYSDLPKQFNLIGTRILKSNSNNNFDTTADTLKSSKLLSWNTDGLYEYANNNIDNVIITYFLRPNDLQQTQLAIKHIVLWKQYQQKYFNSKRSTPSSVQAQNVFSSTQYHRLLYIPQITSCIRQLHIDFGLYNPNLSKSSTTSTGGSNTSTNYNTNNVTVHQLQLDIFPLENDVLSIEYDDALIDDCIDETPSILISTCARCILKLQDIVSTGSTGTNISTSSGKISRIQSYGPLAEEVVKKFFTLSIDEYIEEQTSNESNNSSLSYNNNSINNSNSNNTMAGSDVAALIVIDRKVDLVTPLVTTLTYEGLLDEIIGIDCGYIVVPLSTINPDSDNNNNTNTTGSPSRQPSSVNSSTNDGTKTNVIVELGVNGSDTLYNEVRDQHVEKFGSFLQNQAKALQQSHANFTDKNKKKELSEIHQFVKQMPIFTQNLRSLTNHIHIAELIKKTSEDIIFRERWQLERTILEGEICYDQIDDLIAIQYPPIKLLLLLCLQSLCCGGIKASRYDSMKRDIIQTYGYEYLFLMSTLEKLTIIKKREGLWIDSVASSTSSFATLRKLLILINAEVDTVEPDDVSYVSSGYAPIIVRLIQTSMKGWYGREDILREIPGQFIDVSQESNSVHSSKQQQQQQQQQQQSSSARRTESSATVLPAIGGTSTIPIDFATARKRRPTTPNLTTHATWYMDNINNYNNNNNSNNNNNTTAVAASTSDTTPSSSSSSSKKPTLIVFVVGGITYMEIAALRFLSKRPNFPYHIICVSTKIINGKQMIQSLSSSLSSSTTPTAAISTTSTSSSNVLSSSTTTTATGISGNPVPTASTATSAVATR